MPVLGAFLIAFVVFLPQEAYAYIDPGTGSLILQSLVAGGVAALAFFASCRRKIKTFFQNLRVNKDKK